MYLRPDPYQEILQGLLVSLQVNEGIIKLTGRKGAGKTALCNALHDDLQANAQPVLLFSEPPANASALHKAITDRLALDGSGNFTRALSAWLRARDTDSKPLVLIFDEAQKLDAPTFSAIRMLCNIQNDARSLVRVVLCGSNELDDRIAGPALRAVTQFISQSFTLPYLTREQVRDFCQAYWLGNGLEPKQIDERALSRLLHDTKGRPGELYAWLEQDRAVTQAIEAYVADSTVAQDPPAGSAGKTSARWRTAFAIAVGLMAIAASAAWLHFTTSADVLPEPQVPAIETAPPDAVAPADTQPEAPAAAEVQAEVSEPATAAPATTETATTETAMPVEAFIADWIASWQSRDVDAYLAHYHPEFVPALGTRAEWEQQRRRVIGNAADIMISADAPLSNAVAQAGMRVVRFWLTYRAANYADRTLKELVLAPVDGEWRIRLERNLRTEPL